MAVNDEHPFAGGSSPPHGVITKAIIATPDLTLFVGA